MCMCVCVCVSEEAGFALRLESINDYCEGKEWEDFPVSRCSGWEASKTFREKSKQEERKKKENWC